jgi:two-component system NarL family sensor kinase
VSSDRERLVELAGQPAVRTVLLGNAWRGVRLQLVLRGVLAAFVVVTVVAVPPEKYAAAALLVAIGYAVWTAAVALSASVWRLGLIRWSVLTLLVDVAVLAALCFVASASDQQSWTTDVLVNGFFLIPVIAATQLRPWVCVVVVVPTVAVYFWTSVAARESNGDTPWSVILLGTLALAGVSAGSVLLSYVQRSRVVDIGSLAGDRSRLLAEMVALEERERRELAEALHDGALQYVLAARQEIDDVATDPDAVRRVDEALTAASRLLRSTTAELHPAVLQHAGLIPALRELASSIGARGGLVTGVDAAHWPEGSRTDADALLLSTARELLTNVVKHAHAGNATITVEVRDGRARLVVEDDGAGLDTEAAAARVAAGHIGLESRRIRLESVGGTLHLEPATPHGTRAVAEVPLAGRTDR